MLALCHVALLLTPLDPYGDPLPPGAITRLGSGRLAHPSDVWAVAFSSDGKTLLSRGGGLHFWDATTGRRVGGVTPAATVRGLEDTAPDLSSRARLEMGEVLLLDPFTDNVQHTLKGPKTFADYVAFSPDGKTLAIGWRDELVQFWEVATGKEQSTLKLPGDPQYLAYPPGGKTLLVATRKNKVRECTLWDLKNGEAVRTWAGWQEPVVLSPDGKRLLTGGEGGRLHVWDVGSGDELYQLATGRPDGGIMQEAASSAVFSADGTRLAAADKTDRVHMWDLKAGKELFCTERSENRIRALAFSPDGKTLAVGDGRLVRLLDAVTSQDRLSRVGHADPVEGVWVSPNGESVATRSADGCHRWDAATGKERDHWPGKRFLGFATGGDLLWRDGGAVVRARADTGREVSRMAVYERETDEYERLSVRCADDGKTLVTGSDDRTVRLWDVGKGEVVWQAKRADKDRRFPADLGRHHPLGFAAGGKEVVTYAGDAVVRVYDAKTGDELRWLRVNAAEAYLSPDGKHLITNGKNEAAPDGKSQSGGLAPLRIWDMTKDEPESAEFYPSESVRSLAFSPDSKRVAVGIGEGIVLIDFATKKEVSRLTGHRGKVTALTFSPDGTRLVSGSDDLTALVWDTR